MGHTGAHRGQIRTNKGTGGHIRGIEGHTGAHRVKVWPIREHMDAERQHTGSENRQ